MDATSTRTHAPWTTHVHEAVLVCVLFCLRAVLQAALLTRLGLGVFWV
jgi:hypothetical protein